MRITVLGGTRFIGAATVEELVDHGHDVTVVHRGRSELDDAASVPHVHVDRHDAEALRHALADVEAIVDTNAYTRHDAEGLIAALPQDAAVVVLSSMDVYRAFHRLNKGLPPVDSFPLDETSTTRTGDERHLFRGREVPPGVGAAGMDEYENLDVEEVVLAVGATVLRLPMVYGERDPMRREAFVLDRLHQDRIEIGAGTLLWTKGYVRDVAAAIRLAVETGAGAGRALNIGERRTLPVATWAQAILTAAESDAQLVTVADDRLTEDLFITGTLSQHVIVDSSLARELLGWSDSDADTALRASVAWHLAHPPAART